MIKLSARYYCVFNMGADEQSEWSLDLYFSWGTKEPKYSHRKRWKSQGLGYTSILFGLHYSKKKSLDSIFSIASGAQLSFTPLTGFITPELALKMSIFTKKQPYLTLPFHDITNQKKHTRFCCKLMPCCLNSLMDLRNDNDFFLSNNHH